MRITSLVSGTVGLISGAVSMAVPMACEMSPFNSFAIGSIAAIGVGVTTYSLWHKHGKGYFAEYLAKQVDAAIKAQRDSLQKAVSELIKKKLFPSTILNLTSFSEGTVQSVVKKCLDDYATNSEIVRKVLDDIDNRICYENNALLKKFVNQATDSIIDYKFSGCYAPFKSFLRKPLNRIVATVVVNLLIKTTEVVAAKVKDDSVTNVINNVKSLFDLDLNKTINLRSGLAGINFL